MLYGYVIFIVLLIGITMTFMVRLVVRRQPRKREKSRKPLSRAEIEERLRAADESGIDTAAARAELSELASRQQEGTIHLCFFGEISSGKSSLIKALLPGAASGTMMSMRSMKTLAAPKPAMPVLSLATTTVCLDGSRVQVFGSNPPKTWMNDVTSKSL